jgi:hypothetical protein
VLCLLERDTPSRYVHSSHRLDLTSPRFCTDPISPCLLFDLSVESLPISSHHVQTPLTQQLTDTLNSTNIYAESEAFELKPAGSAYPTVTPAGAADPATATQSGSMGTATSTGTQSSAAASSAPANGAEAMGVAWGKVGGVVGLGVVGALLV